MKTFAWMFLVFGLCLLSGLLRAEGLNTSREIAVDAPAKVTEHLNAQVPLDLPFKDQDGKEVTLRKYCSGVKPVLLTLNYAGCPSLCSLQLNGLSKSLRSLEWTAGKEFEIVTVDIDPLETTEMARAMQERLVEEYGRPEAKSGWHVLTGAEKDIKAVADSVGFGYRYNTANRAYEHAAVMMFLTPDGRVSSYRYGWEYPGGVLKLTLLDASQGKLGSILEQAVQYCLSYDSKEGKNKLVVMNLMKLIGAGTLLFLFCFVGSLWLWEYRRHKKKAINAGSMS